MNCQKFEDLLSAYLEGELTPEDRHSFNVHLAACPSCASLLAAFRDTREALDGFPELEPSPVLIEKLSTFPRKKRFFRPVIELLLRPALQPVYAASTVLLIALSFVLFHHEGRGIQKAVSRHLHVGYSKVEKLYAEAGSIKDELVSYTNVVLDSFKAINPLKEKEE